MSETTTKWTAVAYGLPSTISTSSTREKAEAAAVRKARKAMRNMKATGQLPQIVSKPINA